MGIFGRIFGKGKNKNVVPMIPEQDQASGYEPIPRYPGSVMVSHSGGEENVYIEYETVDPFDRVTKWYENQMETKGWEIAEGTCGGAGFLTLVYQKEDIRCSIGVKWRPSHNKIWIDYRV